MQNYEAERIGTDFIDRTSLGRRLIGRTLVCSALLGLAMLCALPAKAFAATDLPNAATPATMTKPTPATPATPATPMVTATTPPPLTWSLHGSWSAWGLNQHGFLLGRDHPLDDADYVVQNLRLFGKVEGDKVGVVARMDLAQGWWGVDNAPDVATGVATASDGKVSATTVSNPYALFRNKDTNYGVHVDWAWLWFDAPWSLPLKFSVGRQPFIVGNRLVLDQTYDGIRVDSGALGPVAFSAFWAKVHEGGGSISNPVGLLMNDDDNRADGDLIGATLAWKSDAKATHTAELFGLRYTDGQKDDALLPGGLGYFHSRFQSQISDAMVFGLTAQGTFAVAAGLTYNLEIDVLRGSDDVNNGDFQANLIDKNNGDLEGYNAYLKVDQKVELGVPFNVGVTLGLGSGDDDPTSGKGNINRIQTMGYFPLTNVWEDSVMPDVEGISPQGLGSPVSRGYRELENTTVAMLNVGANVTKTLRLEAAYAYLQATQPIAGWNADGPTSETSSDIGMEVDWNIKWQIRPGLSLAGLYGVFVPGDGAALLINGHTKHKAMVWEAKHVLNFAF